MGLLEKDGTPVEFKVKSVGYFVVNSGTMSSNYIRTVTLNSNSGVGYQHVFNGNTEYGDIYSDMLKWVETPKEPKESDNEYASVSDWKDLKLESPTSNKVIATGSAPKTIMIQRYSYQ